MGEEMCSDMKIQLRRGGQKNGQGLKNMANGLLVDRGKDEESRESSTGMQMRSTETRLFFEFSVEI